MLPLLAAAFNILVTILLPLGVLVYCLAKKRHWVLPFLAGIATFLLSQSFTRIPLLGWLNGQLWFVAFTYGHPALYSIFLGFTAGLFEETGRYLAMRLMKNHRGPSQAMVFGLGHGGIEAVLYGGVQTLQALFANLPLLMLSSPLIIALTGFERLFAIAAHVCFSLLVMRAVEKRNPAWLLLAILLHTALDAPIGLLPLWFGVGTLGIELYLACFVVLLAIFTWTTRSRPSGQNPPNSPQRGQS